MAKFRKNFAKNIATDSITTVELFWRSENMGKFSENRHISDLIDMSCKVYLPP